MIHIVPVLLLVIIAFVLVFNRRKSTYSYDCFLLTLPESIERQKKFFRSHNSNVPIEVVHGVNTKNIKTARKYEDIIDPEYFEKAVEMHYNPTVIRPDITYFNLGAIGAYMGHTGIMKKCIERGIKHALIFEDNVIVKRNRLYDEIQKVIDELGDNFEMCFFHCLSRIPTEVHGDLEKVVWVSSMKCYLINVQNMEKYMKYYFPIDNHVDNKTEDIIGRGARVYYKDLRRYMRIDRSGPSTIGHSDHGRKQYFSRQNPSATPDDVLFGY
jgi:GR25 family glycosyltransferase involved in LPS biosynthesis